MYDNSATSAVSYHRMQRLTTTSLGAYGAASAAFGRLKTRLWKERGVRLSTKVAVYKAVVITTLCTAVSRGPPIDVTYAVLISSTCVVSVA